MMATGEIVDKIYEAALVPEHWQGVLDMLARLASAKGCVLMSSRDSAGHWVASDSLAELMHNYFAGGWHKDTSVSSKLFALPGAEFYSDADVIPDEEMDRLAFITDFMRPNGIGYTASTFIRVPNGDSLVVTAQKKLGDGPVDRPSLHLLTEFRPHIARAAMLATRLEFERVKGANQALEMTGLPSAAIDQDGRVIDCNALFANLRDHIVIASGNKLKLKRKGAQEAMEDSLRLAATPYSGRAAIAKSLPLPGTDGLKPAVLHLLPVRRNARDIFVQAAFFVILTPLADPVQPGIDLIQGLFDLSTSEARIAGQLAAGSDVNKIAADLGVSRETIRFHLKNIFAKTGVGRQAELAAIIAKIPYFFG